MQSTRNGGPAAAGRATAGLLQVLVISQHETVRRQLDAYLRRSSAFNVVSDEPSVGAIVRTHPDVLVLDLSQVRPDSLREMLVATRSAGARVIALASMFEPNAERAVTEAGGLYRLKSAGADGLADIVAAAPTRR